MHKQRLPVLLALVLGGCMQTVAVDQSTPGIYDLQIQLNDIDTPAESEAALMSKADELCGKDGYETVTPVSEKTKTISSFANGMLIKKDISLYTMTIRCQQKPLS